MSKSFGRGGATRKGSGSSSYYDKAPGFSGQHKQVPKKDGAVYFIKGVDRVDPSPEEEAESKVFKHVNKQHFEKARAAWISKSEARFLKPEEVEEPQGLAYGAEDPLKGVAVDEMIGHLRNYSKFREPMELSTMVDLLNVLWDEDIL